MELSYIREFVVLAEMGNYLEAADALFIAQSSFIQTHKKALSWILVLLYLTGRPEK